MTEVTPAAEAVATTPVDPNAQAQTPATTETTAAPAEQQAQQSEAKDDQPRDENGQFTFKHPRVQKLQEKIGELTRTKHDTAREVARLKAEAEALRKQIEAPANIDPNDFAAHQAHEVRRAIKAEKYEDTVARAQDLQQQSQRVTEDIVAVQAEALRDQIPDIDKIFRHPSQGGPVITPLMAEAISRTQNGALVAYKLASDPQTAVRLANSDPYTVAVEIGRLSAEIKPATPARRVSQAPVPVQTVSGGVGNPQPDLASLDFKTYEKLRNEQELARR